MPRGRIENSLPSRLFRWMSETVDGEPRRATTKEMADALSCPHDRSSEIVSHACTFGTMVRVGEHANGHALYEMVPVESAKSVAARKEKVKKNIAPAPYYRGSRWGAATFVW